MTIRPREPLGLKQDKHGKDPKYLNFVRQLPCCICENYGEYQGSGTQAHHTICDRHSTEKVPDCEAIPLCEGHHQGLLDTTKPAIHRGKRSWVARYGSDREYIAGTLDEIELTFGYTPNSKARP